MNKRKRILARLRYLLSIKSKVAKRVSLTKTLIDELDRDGTLGVVIWVIKFLA